jgi:biotin carboxyl carrier protein
VSAHALIRKTRRLPLKGTVLVQEGQEVTPDTVVARAEIPGIMQTVRVAEQLGVQPDELPRLLKVKVGDAVQPGTVLAESRGLFGLFRTEVKSPIEGTVELISDVSGHVGIRERPTPLEVKAYIAGKVVEVLPEEGVVVETHGSLVQGIFGVGGERLGEIKVLVDHPSQPITENLVTPELAGKVIVGGSFISGAALRKASEVGVVGIVVGGTLDTDLIEFLGYDIGVAITGHEDIPLTLILTEGFGEIRMAERTFNLLRSLEGRLASINGATQIRAGVIRPEVIVPRSELANEPLPRGAFEAQVLEIGSHVRVIREPYFGKLATVTALPPQLVEIPTGAMVRVLEAELEDGERVVVPRANVEIIAE